MDVCSALSANSDDRALNAMFVILCSVSSEFQNVVDMTDISVKKNCPVRVKSLGAPTN